MLVCLAIEGGCRLQVQELAAGHTHPCNNMRGDDNRIRAVLGITLLAHADMGPHQTLPGDCLQPHIPPPPPQPSPGPDPVIPCLHLTG